MPRTEAFGVPKSLTGKVLTDVFMGSDFESQSALPESIVLTASTVFTYPNLLEIGSTVSLEVPSTSSLEVEAYVDQGTLATQVGVVPDAGNAFINPKLSQNVTLPVANDFLVEDNFEIGVGTVLEIPPTSTLEIMVYQPSLARPVNTYDAGSGTTASTSYVDLTGANPGPAASVSIGSRGAAMVMITCDLLQNTTGGYPVMSFAISGATTLAAGIPHEMWYEAVAGGADMKFSYCTVVTGLNPGVNTFTAKYRVAVSGTGTFLQREISVIPL